VIGEVICNDVAILKEEETTVYVDSLGESAVLIGIRGWVKKDDYWTAKWRMTENVKIALDKNGVEIPYNQIVVHTK